MGIGTLPQLYEAAQGRMAPRVLIPPAPVDPGTAFDDARARRTALARTATEVRTAAQAAGRTISSELGKTFPTELNPVYKNILSNPTRAGGGLNPSGKYGGFNNAGDLQSAIEGSAISLGRTSTPQLLRDKATAYYDKLDTEYTEAQGAPERYFKKQRGGYNSAQMPGVDPNKQYSSEGYVGKIVNPSREYATQLSEWYAGATAPADDYLISAQQLENTPLSNLATQIATSAYGMNPDLAAGKFSGLDTTYFNQQRDREYMQQYGMPYADYEAEQKTIPGKYAAEIATTTGYRAADMSKLTAQSPEQMYVSYGTSYKYKDPETDTEVTRNGKAIIETMRDYLYEGELELAAKLAEALGDQDLARILNAQYNLGVTRNIKNEQENEAYAP